ncbi:related to STE23 - Metalloprotease involved in a-factor processing [Pseudozyma flocculosa]|uniref:Related to STE23 - Metalloprotease involved in a-factor processing n=1 Tax=Pseudozyma flocculosa TaxID=84751 RepID=A0A5C3FAC5_9BASI|nr:related to STE23 - Metalloprotease involved in a-factor processing [Pseudozyma flocculosa]
MARTLQRLTAVLIAVLAALLAHRLSSSSSQLSFNMASSSSSPSSPLASKAPGSSRQLATAAAASSSTVGSAGFSFDSLPPGYEVRDSIGDVKTPAPYAVFTRDLEVPSRDDMKYRLVRLANGLEALVIHDEKTDKSSAAMDIRVGHLSDPEELQGLAHFCEHLLFMGTKKYPRENEYSEFLSNHSGGSNAYTGMDNTNYFFDVGPEHFEGALDRFAQFFLEPLFDPSCSEREIKAVDSEHKKNLQSDAWRSFQLEKSLSDASHPYSHFGTGNYQTLWENPKGKGVDVRDELLKFHDRYYSANVMKLVVLGREPLDQLTTWVIDKFSGVRNTGRNPPEFPSSPLKPEQLQKQVFYKTVRDMRSMRIAFPIPDQGPLYRTKPSHFLSHFIGHEGEGSILSHLKRKGWCNRISAGGSDGANGFQFFKINIDLTKDGLAHHEEVLESVFKYIHLLRSSKLEEWTHREVSQLSELMFRFREKSDPADYASAIATEMQMPYPREWILSGAYLSREFDLPQIQQTLDMLSPRNCRVMVAAKTLPDGTAEWEGREKWYGTEYTVRPLPERLLDLAPSDYEDLALPRPNSFVPTNFELKGQLAAERGRKPAPRPTLVSETPAMRVWHKVDDQFGMPKANLFFTMRNPAINATPLAATKTRMVMDLVNDELTEYSYDASLAGLAYSLDSQDNSIVLSVSGYNDKLNVLLQNILKELINFKVDARRFDIIKDRVRRGWENFSMEEPYRHAHFYLTYLLQDKMWTPREKLAELERLTAEEVQAFLPELLQRMHVEVLAHGNLQRDEVQRVADESLATLQSRPINPAELVSQRSLLLPPGSNHVWTLPVTNDANINSALEYYCEVGDPSDVALRAKLSLLSQIAHEPAFDQLRTKEQLGYLVFSGGRRSVGSMGFRIIVQSERDAPYLESRVDSFLDQQLKPLLERMTDDEFAAHQSSVIHKKLQKWLNLNEESHTYWSNVFSGKYDFLSRWTDVEAIGKLRKSDVVDLFMTRIHPSSPTRAKLSVHLASSAKATRFSVEAAEALQGAIEAQRIPVPKEALEALKAQQPAVETVKDFAQQALSQVPDLPKESLKSMMDMIDALAAQFPYKEAADDKQQQQQQAVVASAVPAVEVADPIAFKASLHSSKAAVPVRSLEELFKEPEDEAEQVAKLAQAAIAQIAPASESKANL